MPSMSQTHLKLWHIGQLFYISVFCDINNEVIDRSIGPPLLVYFAAKTSPPCALRSMMNNCRVLGIFFLGTKPDLSRCYWKYGWAKKPVNRLNRENREKNNQTNRTEKKNRINRLKNHKKILVRFGFGF